MNSRFTGKLISAATIMILALCLFSEIVMAAEFSADMTQVTPSRNGVVTMKGKIYVKGIIQRQDLSTPIGKHIIIMRPDKGVIWTLMPDSKNYLEQPTTKIDAKSVPSIESVIKKRTDLKKAGTAKVAGYDCVKYTYKNPERQVSGTVYISTKLQQQLKADTQTGTRKMSYSLSNIKEGKQAMSIFDLPAGYKKVTMPSTGTAMPGTNRGKGMAPPPAPK